MNIRVKRNLNKQRSTYHVYSDIGGYGGDIADTYVLDNEEAKRNSMFRHKGEVAM